MKTSPISQRRVLGAAGLAVVCLLALPQTSLAKDHGKQNQRGKSYQNASAQQIYTSRPRTSFTLSLGTGYAGRGYYYGPPDSAYYYERPDVRYYATREAAPREYYNREYRRSDSTGVSVQQALANRGYYRGAMDGDIGPQSSRAIARYQEDQGLRVTGNITPSLLRSLRLD